jgi:hypothetical protein
MIRCGVSTQADVERSEYIDKRLEITDAAQTNVVAWLRVGYHDRLRLTSGMILRLRSLVRGKSAGGGHYISTPGISIQVLSAHKPNRNQR